MLVISFITPVTKIVNNITREKNSQLTFCNIISNLKNLALFIYLGRFIRKSAKINKKKQG